MKKNNHLQPHELSKLFPPLGETSAAELAVDIKQNGLRQPIVTFEDKILDGVQRYGACQDAEVEPDIQEFETMEAFRQGTHPVDFIMSLNFHRRNISAGQKATIKVEAEKLRSHKFRTFREIVNRGRKSDAVRQHREEKQAVEIIAQDDKPKSLRKMAEEVGLSHDIIHKAATLAKRAPRKFAQVKAGKVSLDNAMKSLPRTARQKQNDKEQETKLKAGLRLSDSINKLLKKARDNGGQIYVELGGYGFRCFQLCKGWK